MGKIEFKIDRRKQKDFFNEKLEVFRKYFLKWIKILTAILAVISLITLILEYGFYLSDAQRQIVKIIPPIVLYGLTFYYLSRLLLDRERLLFIKTHRLELFLIFIIVIYLLFPEVTESILLSINPVLKPENIAYTYLIITQVLALIAVVLEGINQSKKLLFLNVQPAMLLLLSFFVLIALGTILLMMPKATINGSINFLDALFTSASAVTVTGLIVVDTQTYFTFTGHLIIISLIQVGGLGIMTLTSFFAFSSGKTYNLKEYLTIQEILGEESIGGIKKFINQVITATFITEAVAAVLIYFTCDFNFINSTNEKIFFSIFHAISAFCNAGFSILSENLAAAGIQFNQQFLLIIVSLIIIGGIGFPALNDLKNYFIKKFLHKRTVKIRLHTKLVLLTSFLLILFGTIMFFILETSNVIKDQNWLDKLIASIFHSVTTRTAGFNTIDISKIALPTSFLIIILMWIGASPGSTGGGIKTTTFSISLLNLFSISRGKSSVDIFKKKLAEHDINKAFSTIILSMIYIGLATFFLTLTENFPFEDILFEVVSATSTVGLTRGITPHLSNIGKIIIVLSMFIGRIGFLTVTLALFKKTIKHNFDFVEEKIII